MADAGVSAIDARALRGELWQAGSWQVDFRMIIARYRGSLSLPKETLTSPLLSNHLSLCPSVNLSMTTWQAN